MLIAKALPHFAQCIPRLCKFASPIISPIVLSFFLLLFLQVQGASLHLEHKLGFAAKIDVVEAIAREVKVSEPG